MKRLLALALWLCLGVSPALAVGLAQIVGTGTGNSITNITFGAAQTASLVTTAAIPPGSLVAVIMQNGSSSGTSTGFGCTDPAGNTYTAAQAITATTNAATQILYSRTSGDLPNGSTITCTQTAGPNGITGQVLAFSGATSSPFDSASASGITGTGSGNQTIGPTGTLNGPCGAANCEVLIAGAVYAGSGTTATDATYTNTGSGAGSFWANGFLIVSATTAKSFTFSNTTAANFAAQLVAFKAAAAPGGSSGLTTVGAGP